MLTIIPLPSWLEAIRPQWTTLVLVYWVMALPERFGIGKAWMTGAGLDIVSTGLLGQQALSLAVIAYLTQKIYRRIRVFPLWQQAIPVMILVALHMMLILWINGMAGIEHHREWTYWLPVFSSMLMWPVIFVFLRELRRRYRVS